VDFTLPDGWGGTLDTRELRGRPYVVTFLYTGCEDVCPLIAEQLEAALGALGPAADDVAVVAVSTDPRGDTRSAVLEWLQERGVPANFHYVYGPARKLERVWDAYYAVGQDPESEDSTHSASIWLVDAAGRLRTRFSAGAPVAPTDIAHDLRVLLDEVR
jgi:protein SCO1/2